MRVAHEMSSQAWSRAVNLMTIIRAIFLCVVGPVMASAGVGLAQEAVLAPPVLSEVQATLAPSENSSGVQIFFSDNSRKRTWGGAEYLLWFLKDAPLPVPIATTVAGQAAIPAVPANVGALGVDSTQVLSPNRLDAGAFSGMRFTAGRWLDCDNSIGAEVSGFLLPARSAVFTAQSSIQNGPALLVPFIDAAGMANALAVGGMGQASGLINASDRTELWGIRADALFNVLQDDRRSVSLLVGFRYLNLADDLQMAFSATAPDGSNLTFNDRFQTRNQFWGGSLGIRGQWNFDRLFVDLNAGIGLGVMHESVDINGQTVFNSPAASFNGAGGFFSQPSNSGRRTSDVFAVLPEVGVRIGYDVTSALRIFCGYDILYVSNVVRPGDQIDPRLNLSQAFGRPLVGPAAPVPLFNHTDLTIHGVSFGVALRF